MAYIIRFKTVLIDKVRYKTDLTVEEIEASGKMIVRLVQKDHFAEDLKSLKPSSSNIASLLPYKDNDGILRVGGRLRRSNLNPELMHPVLLPGSDKVSELIVRWCHMKVGHGGRGYTLNQLRRSGFWVVCGNTVVRKIIYKCVTCRYLRGKIGVQIMADLPKERTIEAPPFTYCGVDFFGPFIIKDKRKELKRYGAIFTCFGSRAVHLEVACGLDTDTFILTLRRFIGRRGNIRSLHSDNGTNFIGAERELRQALKELDHEKIKVFLNNLGSDWCWKNNPPSSSHMGGVWERQIRSTRAILTVLLKNHGRSLNDESLNTLMVETEAIINSRPLTIETLGDVNSQQPLAPINLLTMKSNVVSPPPGEFIASDVYSKRRWRRVQHIANEFWNRWRKEYLQHLQNRQKWKQKTRNFQVNDVVLLKDNTLEMRNHWPMARIVKLYNDDKGVVRSVDIFLGSSRTVLHRPITKLVLLLENK